MHLRRAVSQGRDGAVIKPLTAHRLWLLAQKRAVAQADNPEG